MYANKCIRFHTVRQAAEIWGVSEETVRAMKRAGVFPVYQTGPKSKIFIPASVVVSIQKALKGGFRIV